MSTFRLRIAAAAAVITLAAGAVSLAIPAGASPAAAAPARHQYAHITEEMHTCLGLHGDQVRTQLCRWTSHSQMWRAGLGPHVVTWSGRCLTATARKTVITAPCGERGQAWTATFYFDGYTLGSRRFPGLCLSQPPRPGYPPARRFGRVVLEPCGEGITQAWVPTGRP